MYPVFADRSNHLKRQASETGKSVWNFWESFAFLHKRGYTLTEAVSLFLSAFNMAKTPGTAPTFLQQEHER